MNEEILNKLYSLVETTSDAASLTDSLQTAKNSLFKTKNKGIIDEAALHMPAKFGILLKDAISASKTDPTNLNQVKSLLDAFTEALSGLEEVSLILAIDPPQKTISSLSVALKKSFGQKTIMSLDTDPDILGGAIVIANGRYLDYSLRKKLNILFEARKEELTKLVDENP